MLQRRPLVILLAVACAVFAAALIAEIALLRPLQEAAPAGRAAAPETRLLPPVQTIAAEQAYPEVANRPLFVPTRRPSPPAVAAAAPAFQRGQYSLQGVIVAGQSRTAMLREKSNNKIHRVEAGQELNGIRVVQIDPTAVTLGLGDEREVLPLTVQKPAAVAVGKGGAPPAAPAPAQGAFGPPPGGYAGKAPGAPPKAPQATTSPMTPEELLARRRARRAQQNQ